MCYDSEVTVDAEHLAVAWWDCDDGEYRFDHIFYPATVQGFDTEMHTVEFAVDCLRGPFVVVQLIERPCQGTIVVSMLGMDPYCEGYTNGTPRFRTLITDNMGGPGVIDQSSIQFKLKKPDEPYITIYNGYDCDWCARWANGFGQYSAGGYDQVSGILGVGWNDSLYYQTFYYNGDQYPCPNCYLHHYSGNYNYYSCRPADPLPEGDSYFAKVSAQNEAIQFCEQTWEFNVDRTPPTVEFADSVGAYVGENPYFCITFDDAKSGVDKNSIWIDIWGDEGSSPDPNQHSPIGTVPPAQLKWIDDYTVCVSGTFEYSDGYLHVYVYGGPDCLCADCTYPQFYYYECGIADCVGNHTNVFWQYFTVDADGPVIKFVGDDYCDEKLQFSITDDKSGVKSVYVYEDSSLVDSISQDVHNGDFWWYDPSAGVKRVDIEAKDNIGNKRVFSFNMPSDCQGPTVTFADGYVCMNPTIEFWVTDPAGVDWTTVNVYVAGCGSEYCYFLAEDLGDRVDQETGKVTISGCHLDCSDGNTVGVWVYSGTNYTGNGPWDLNGNYGKYRYCTFVVDAVAPSISVSATDERPIRITIKDAKSGVDWSSLEFYEDGDDMIEDIDIDTETGVIIYDPDEAGGFEVEIRVNDMTGCNLATKTFKVVAWSELALAFGLRPHNEPNPFNPDVDGPTKIVPELNKCAHITVKIYDFAGEFVRDLTNGGVWKCPDSYLTWDGTTDGGTEVANGTYLCYIHARDEMGQVKTQVIKITVLRAD
jgi:hypothetical protein